MARSNVSNSLKDLQGWGIVRLAHVMGDRRDHFESMKDVWEMFRTVLDEHKKREIDPTVRLLKECLTEAESLGVTDKHTEERLRALSEFFDHTSAWYNQVRSWPMSAVIRFVKLGDKARKALGLGK